ncbi:formyltetrahydrofolate deformylase [Alicyclobacillaceae bacterium I2511]|nr:formyltetrahydrofolate deformylase [Alicyclobacillaceae bacterium I2511]
MTVYLTPSSNSVEPPLGSDLKGARLLISCPDAPGIVAAVAQFLYRQGANILQSDQHSTDNGHGRFYMRVEFQAEALNSRFATLQAAFVSVAKRFDMEWKMTRAKLQKRFAVFVSKEDHCLRELLWAWQAGDLWGQPVMVISNHVEVQSLVESFGIPFHHFPVNSDTKPAVEEKQLQLLQGQVDFLVLARYMQILTPQFVSHYPLQVINIHHSFLPAFVGRNPYGRAYDRGVKLIGATAHYVTPQLDEGPIIEQDVQRVDHRYGAEDMKRMGRRIERTVLVRAVQWHLEDRILVHGNKTIVFPS